MRVRIGAIIACSTSPSPRRPSRRAASTTSRRATGTSLGRSTRPARSCRRRRSGPCGTRATARPSVRFRRRPSDLVAPVWDPPARRGTAGSTPSCRVADPQGHRSLPRGAPVEEERDEVRHNVLRDGRRRNNGHGVTRSGPSTGASRRGAAHDPVSTNDGPTGGRGTRGGDRGLGAARGARRSRSSCGS